MLIIGVMLIIGFSPVDLRKSFANFVKSIYIKNIHISDAVIDNSLETFTASRLKPLDKNPEVRSIGERLR